MGEIATGTTTRIALVTGVGRTQDIGQAICQAFATQGLDLFFTYRSRYGQMMPWPVDPSEPERIQRELMAMGVRCDRMEMDLSLPAAIPMRFDHVVDRLGVPSILVNNAAYSLAGT